MRLGLIGATGHWQTYAPGLEHVRGLTLAAVATAGPGETTGTFDHAPGLTTGTRSRKTFPGIAPWVGIHAFDWLHWILGDVFTSVQGREGTTARPDYPACASQAAFVLTMENGGVASVTLDYLRPETAPTHGDERLRIAGAHGMIETGLVDRRVMLTTADRPPRSLPLDPQPDLFTQFARSLRDKTPPPLSLHEACRVTEIALKAQQAADTGQMVSLRDSPYRGSD